MRVGVAHHYGWAVAVTASAAHVVVDRRRIELLAPGLPGAPIHHEGGTHELHNHGPRLEDDELAAVVEKVRASALTTTAASFDELEAALPEPIHAVCVRAWAPDFPTAIATLRRPPYEARADSVMYCQVIAEVAHDRGWAVHLYDAKSVEGEAIRLAGVNVLTAPRQRLGAPWAKDHRVALAATIVA